MNDSVEFPEQNEHVPEPVGEPEIGGEGWSGADIEEAYLKALHAMEDIPGEPGEAEVTAEGSEPPQSKSFVAEALPVPDAPPAAGSPPSELSASETAPPQPAPEFPVVQAVEIEPTNPSGMRLARGTERHPQAALDQNSNVSPVQVIEAALFVGGAPLTARKICALVRGSFDTAFVEQTLDELNAAYLAQGRPYEIRLGEGGYRLELRPEYDRLRHRVYGSGPREVRLAQDVLEVLALVAYRQPISQKEIESHGKENAANLLRQLLRRDLISFERGPLGRKDLQYQTTPRFLSVFGLAGIDDLPQAEDLAKK